MKCTLRKVSPVPAVRDSITGTNLHEYEVNFSTSSYFLSPCEDLDRREEWETHPADMQLIREAGEHIKAEIYKNIIPLVVELRSSIGKLDFSGFTDVVLKLYDEVGIRR